MNTKNSNELVPPSETHLYPTQNLNQIPCSRPIPTEQDFYFRSGWFWGIENLTRSPSGFLLWREGEIAKLNFPSPSEERAACQEFSIRSLFLEGLCVPVTVATVNWFWAWFEGISALNPYLQLLARTPRIFEKDKSVLLMVSSRPAICWEWNGFSTSHFEISEPADKWVATRGFVPLQAGQIRGQPLRLISWQGIVKRLTELKVPPEIISD